MSIASEITRISDNVADAYTAANAKGATMPVSQNSDNLATTIATIPTTAPTYYVEKTKNTNNVLTNSSNIIDLKGINDIGENALRYQYNGISFPANTTVDFSSLTQITGKYACGETFSSTSGITSVNLSNLTTINGNNCCNAMFSGSSSLTSVNLNSLTTISGTNACVNMFASTNIISLKLNSLTTLNGGSINGFTYNNQSLTEVEFNSLTNISSTIGSSLSTARPFGGCTNLESVSFGGLKSTTFSSAVNQLQYLFYSNTGSTATNGCTVHFPSNFDPSDPNHTFDASTLTGYPTFGGSASYIHVAFDLPATES